MQILTKCYFTEHPAGEKLIVFQALLIIQIWHRHPKAVNYRNGLRNKYCHETMIVITYHSVNFCINMYDLLI